SNLFGLEQTFQRTRRPGKGNNHIHVGQHGRHVTETPRQGHAEILAFVDGIDAGVKPQRKQKPSPLSPSTINSHYQSRCSPRLRDEVESSMSSQHATNDEQLFLNYSLTTSI